MKKILVVLSILPLLVNGIALAYLPDTIPAHYDFNGTVDRIGSKYEILIFPIVIVGVMVLFLYLSRYYANRSETKNQSQILQLGIAISVVYNVLNAYILMNALDVGSNAMSTSILQSVVGMILVVSGVCTRRASQNSFFGVRTKWTLLDQDAWKKTNRLGCVCLIAIGILCFTNLIDSIFLLVLSLGVMSIVLVVYSYYVYKQNVVKM